MSKKKALKRSYLNVTDIRKLPHSKFLILIFLCMISKQFLCLYPISDVKGCVDKLIGKY